MTELEVLRGKLRERMNELADALATGTCSSYENYKYICGTIEGLAYAERDILDMQYEQEKRNG